ncbi:MAG: cellulase family glycosylhydrolase [Bryobacteraceae bacterium]
MSTISRFAAGLLLASLAWGQEFVQRSGGTLTLNGSLFRFGGTNSYPLMYSPQSTVDQVLSAVASSNLKVVRMWAFYDAVSPAGTYFQYFNTTTGQPVYNDTGSGLANVDYAVYRAGQLGIKLIIPFTNNWPDFGGMDIYVDWLGGKYHDQFYTDPTIRTWYKAWISHLLNHVNTISGIAYKDDPTIMAWELANEPECGGSGLPTSGTCTNQTIISWISDTSLYVKSVDPNHLVAVGDEGYFCDPSSTEYIDDCGSGVDSMGFSQVASIDLVGFHLYPDTWGQSIAWSETYINDHVAEANTLGKPLYMGEFGLLSGNAKEEVYNDWTNLIFTGGGSGAMFWDILPGTPPASAAESASSFDLEQGSPVLQFMGDFAQIMAANAEQTFAPVAGYRWATTPFGQSATLDVLFNDVAFGSAKIDPTTIDLDPNTPGQQTSFAVNGGEFNVVGQTVQFTPNSGFTGSVTGSYTVADTNQQLSNVGYLFVTVNPVQTGWAILDSFESGTDGWGALPSSAASGTVSQSSAFHTDGSYSLQINVIAGGWFGLAFPAPIDLSHQSSLAVDIETTSAGGSSAFAFQSGSNFDWCQSAAFQTMGLFSTTTVTVSLQQSQLTCYSGAPDLTSVHTLYVYLASPGTYYIDNLRAAAVTGSATPLLPSITNISNSAGGQAGVSANAYVSIYGSNFAPAGTLVTWGNSVINNQLPTSLSGLSVSMGGTPAYIEAVTPGQINILVPSLSAGPTEVTVTTQTGSSLPYVVTDVAVQPAFFEWPGSQVVATDLSYNWVVQNGTFSVPTTPAKPGETIILWGTGFGPTTPAAPPGQVVPPQTFSVNGVVVTVGGVKATVLATALSPGAAGLYQSVIQVPSNLANGDYPIVATVGGVQSPAGVKLTVQQ